MKPHDHGIVVSDGNDITITISRLRSSWTNKNCLIIDFLEYLYGHRGQLKQMAIVTNYQYFKNTFYI